MEKKKTVSGAMTNEEAKEKNFGWSHGYLTKDPRVTPENDHTSLDGQFNL